MTIPTIPVEEVPRFAKDTRGFATRAVQAGSSHDPVTGAVITPVSTFSLPPPPHPTSKENKKQKTTNKMRGKV